MAKITVDVNINRDDWSEAARKAAAATRKAHAKVKPQAQEHLSAEKAHAHLVNKGWKHSNNDHPRGNGGTHSYSHPDKPREHVQVSTTQKGKREWRHSKWGSGPGDPDKRLGLGTSTSSLKGHF